MEFNRVCKSAPKTKIRQRIPEISHISPHNPQKLENIQCLQFGIPKKFQSRKREESNVARHLIHCKFNIKNRRSISNGKI